MSEEKLYTEIPPYRYNRSGEIVRDKDGVPLSIRNGQEVITHLFQDELVIRNNINNQSAISKLLGIKPKGIEYFMFVNGKNVEKTLQKAPCDMQDFFADQSNILVVGDGDGRSSIDMAAKYTNCTFLGFDRALTKEIKAKKHERDNLSHMAMDWNYLSLPDKSIDRVLMPYSQLFHDTMSIDALYELQRVTKKDAILRGNFNFGAPDYGLAYGTVISKMGWNCWINFGNQIIIAQKTIEQPFTKQQIKDIYKSLRSN